MARKIGIGSGTPNKGSLEKKETLRETRTFQKGSKDSLDSISSQLKKLAKGIKKLNSNVGTIKTIEAANLALDFKTMRDTARANKGASDAYKFNEKMDANSKEMSARNEAGLHDISKGIGKLHSLLAGDNSSEAKSRQSLIQSERKNSLFKHRKMIDEQGKFMDKMGVAAITDLDDAGKAAWDSKAAEISARHSSARSINLSNIGTLKGGNGLGGSGSSGNLTNVVGQIKANTDKTVWTLLDIKKALTSKTLRDLENKREGKKDKHKFKKTSKSATGLMALMAAMGLAGMGSLVSSLIAGKGIKQVIKPSTGHLDGKGGQGKPTPTKKVKDKLPTKTVKDKFSKRFSALSTKFGKTKLVKFLVTRFAVVGAAALFSGPVAWLVAAAGAGFLAKDIFDALDEFEKDAIADEKALNNRENRQSNALKKFVEEEKNMVQDIKKNGVLMRDQNGNTQKQPKSEVEMWKNNGWTVVGAAPVSSTTEYVAERDNSVFKKVWGHKPTRFYLGNPNEDEKNRKAVPWHSYAEEYDRLLGGKDWHTQPQYADDYRRFRLELFDAINNFNHKNNIDTRIDKDGKPFKVNSDNTSTTVSQTFYGIPGQMA